MVSPDLQDCTYTAEVLKTRGPADDLALKIAGLSSGPRSNAVFDVEGGPVTVAHGFFASAVPHHRSQRSVRDASGQEVEVPRQAGTGTRRRYLYDALVAYAGRHILVAVPFHSLGEEVFPRIDRALAGTRAAYEILDIKNIVIRLGTAGRIPLPDIGGEECELGVTRCQLNYVDEKNRTKHLQSVRLSGDNLGITEEYRFLTRSIATRDEEMGSRRAGDDVSVTPVLLGFSLYIDGVRKAGAVTDRHGNFKVFVGPGLRRVIRLFRLLNAIEKMERVASTSPNLPIFQARSIREEGAD